MEVQVLFRAWKALQVRLEGFFVPRLAAGQNPSVSLRWSCARNTRISIFPAMPAINRISAAAAGLAVLVFAGCSSVKPAPLSAEKVCRDKFEAAKKDFDKRHDPDAQTKLRDIGVNCISYDYAEEAQYMLAQSHYRTEQWIEAQTEFQILTDHWERSKYYPEARWKIAHAAYLQAPSWDRDPSLTQTALEKADAFLSDFATGPWTDSAKADREDVLDRLAQRQYETAALYLKMDEPQAATIYFQLLLKDYPDSKRVPKARLELAKSYAQLDQFDRARESLDSLKSDSVKAAPLREQIASTQKLIEKSHRKFEERRAREAAEARQDKL